MLNRQPRALTVYIIAVIIAEEQSHNGWDRRKPDTDGGVGWLRGRQNFTLKSQNENIIEEEIKRGFKKERKEKKLPSLNEEVSL